MEETGGKWHQSRCSVLFLYHKYHYYYYYYTGEQTVRDRAKEGEKQGDTKQRTRLSSGKDMRLFSQYDIFNI